MGKVPGRLCLFGLFPFCRSVGDGSAVTPRCVLACILQFESWRVVETFGYVILKLELPRLASCQYRTGRLTPGVTQLDLHIENENENVMRCDWPISYFQIFLIIVISGTLTLLATADFLQVVFNRGETLLCHLL